MNHHAELFHTVDRRQHRLKGAASSLFTKTKEGIKELQRETIVWEVKSTSAQAGLCCVCAVKLEEGPCPLQDVRILTAAALCILRGSSTVRSCEENKSLSFMKRTSAFTWGMHSCLMETHSSTADCCWWTTSILLIKTTTKEADTITSKRESNFCFFKKWLGLN